MKTIKFRVNPNSIRKANNSLKVRGIDGNVKETYTGVITAKVVLNGVKSVREISGDKIKEAYGKSLREYSAKL